MKFEKVYDGLFLVAKKRYYGKMYESESSGPKYEGKGLECVRRDGISLTSNLMTKMLNKLIDDRDLSKLKEMFKEECTQIINN
jgi:DNA polymerase elongation subunit (family B)